MHHHVNSLFPYQTVNVAVRTYGAGTLHDMIIAKVAEYVGLISACMVHCA